MPQFVPVTNPEKSRAEQSADELKKHRNWENRGQVCFRDSSVKAEKQGRSQRDIGKQSLQKKRGNVCLIKDDKGLWIKHSGEKNSETDRNVFSTSNQLKNTSRNDIDNFKTKKKRIDNDQNISSADSFISTEKHSSSNYKKYQSSRDKELKHSAKSSGQSQKITSDASKNKNLSRSELNGQNQISHRENIKYSKPTEIVSDYGKDENEASIKHMTVHSKHRSAKIQESTEEDEAKLTLSNNKIPVSKTAHFCEEDKSGSCNKDMRSEEQKLLDAEEELMKSMGLPIDFSSNF